MKNWLPSGKTLGVCVAAIGLALWSLPNAPDRPDTVPGVHAGQAMPGSAIPTMAVPADEHTATPKRAQKPPVKAATPKQHKPAPKQQKPVQKQQRPVQKQQRPAPKAQKPAAKPQKPAAKQQRPAAKQQKPAAKQATPAKPQVRNAPAPVTKPPAANPKTPSMKEPAAERVPTPVPVPTPAPLDPTEPTNKFSPYVPWPKSQLRVRVIDGRTQRPIEGAEVVIIETEQRMTTGADGFTEWTDVPIIRDPRYRPLVAELHGQMGAIAYKNGYRDSIHLGIRMHEGIRNETTIWMYRLGPGDTRIEPVLYQVPYHRLWLIELADRFRSKTQPGEGPERP